MDLTYFAAALAELQLLRRAIGHARDLELAKLSAFLIGVEANISRVESRLKDDDSIVENYLIYIGVPMENVPLEALLRSVTDFIGLRVVVMYDSDVDVVAEHLALSYGHNFEQVFTVEDMTRGMTFGYRATHWKFPFQDVAFRVPLRGLPIMCEVQVRTILSDAWAQHSHKMIYQNPNASQEEERAFARVAATLETLDSEINRLAMRVDVGEVTAEREDLSLVLARQEAYDFLKEELSPMITEAAIQSFIDQVADLGLKGPEARSGFMNEIRYASELSKSEKLNRLGGLDELTRLKIGLYWADRSKYVGIVPPHLMSKSTDLLLLG